MSCDNARFFLLDSVIFLKPTGVQFDFEMKNSSIIGDLRSELCDYYDKYPNAYFSYFASISPKQYVMTVSNEGSVIDEMLKLKGLKVSSSANVKPETIKELVGFMRNRQKRTLNLKQHRFKIEKSSKEIVSSFMEKQISNSNLTKRFTNFSGLLNQIV